ncbi:MAG: sensor histidine kinase [Acidobacteriota bacterium]
MGEMLQDVKKDLPDRGQDRAAELSKTNDALQAEIDERRRTEQALMQSRAEFQALLESAPDAIVNVDADGRIVLVNSQTEKMFGYSREELLGQPVEVLIPPRYHRAHIHHRGGYTASPTTRPMGIGLKLAGRRKEGSEFPVEISLSPVRTQNGFCVMSIIRDVSDRQRAEERLSESESRFRTLVEQVRDYAIFGLDRQGVVTSWNKGAERVYGYGSEEIVGQHFSRFFTLAEKSSGKPPRELEIAAAEGVFKEVGQRVRKDGVRIWVDVLITALRDPDGTLRGFAKVTRDITERKRAQEEIAKLNEELEHRVHELSSVNQELETFSYSVSHDLRAPLRAIAGFSQALEEDYADVLDKQGMDYARRVNAATQRLNQLIDDMLTLSRVTRSEMSRDTLADLSSMAQSIVAQWRATQPDRQVEIVIQPHLETRGDPRLLRIALENLLGNAWKFTSKVPRARIELGTAGTEDDRIVYFVRDNGAGFDMTYSDKLFGPFQRLHTATEFPGTGIGLATVQRIIHRHGGRVWADSVVGEGATFYFTL